MDSISNPEGLLHFNSECLLYRAAENTDSDKEFIQKLLNDPTIQTMSTGRRKGPLFQKHADEFIKLMQDALLGVLSVSLHPPRRYPLRRVANHQNPCPSDTWAFSTPNHRVENITAALC